MSQRTGRLIVIYRIVALRYHNLDYRSCEPTECNALYYAASRVTLQPILSNARNKEFRKRKYFTGKSRPAVAETTGLTAWPRHSSSCFWQRELRSLRVIATTLSQALEAWIFGEYSTLNMYIQTNRDGLTKEISSSAIASDFGGARFEFRSGHHLFWSEALRGFPMSPGTSEDSFVQYNLNLGCLHPVACVRSRWWGVLFCLRNVTIVCNPS
jgi:hypothetical protein